MQVKKRGKNMIFNKLAKSILVIALVLVFSHSAWASAIDFKVQVRIIDLTLGKVDGNHRVTHMIAEIVNITDVESFENSKDNQVKEALAFIQKNAKQVTIMVTPEAEKQGKLLGFFNFFINGIHKSGVFKANSTVRAFKVDGLDGWQLLLTECHLLDK